MKKVFMFIVYYPIALIVCIMAWFISFADMVILTPIQSFSKIYIKKTETNLDNDIEKSIQKACKMVHINHETGEIDKDKGGK